MPTAPKKRLISDAQVRHVRRAERPRHRLVKKMIDAARKAPTRSPRCSRTLWRASTAPTTIMPGMISTASDSTIALKRDGWLGAGARRARPRTGGPEVDHAAVIGRRLDAEHQVRPLGEAAFPGGALVGEHEGHPLRRDPG